MLKENLYDISLGQIETFITAARLQSFTKAAASLNMTQSNVSKSIIKLEHALGFKLFVRLYKEIQLTEAGQFLYQAWEKNLSSITYSYSDIYRTIMLGEFTLRIGTANNTDLSKYFWGPISTFSQQNVDIKLELDRDNINRLIEKLANNQLDIIFIPEFLRYSVEKYQMKWKSAAKDHAVIIMPKTNPLAKIKSLSLKDLDGQTFTILDENTEDNKTWIEEFFSAHQLSIRFGKKFSSPENIAYYHTAIEELFFSDNFFHFDVIPENVVAKPVSDVQIGIICAWNEKNNTPGLSKLLPLFPEK